MKLPKRPKVISHSSYLWWIWQLICGLLVDV